MPTTGLFGWMLPVEPRSNSRVPRKAGVQRTPGALKSGPCYCREQIFPTGQRRPPIPVGHREATFRVPQKQSGEEETHSICSVPPPLAHHRPAGVGDSAGCSRAGFHRFNGAFARGRQSEVRRRGGSTWLILAVRGGSREGNDGQIGEFVSLSFVMLAVGACRSRQHDCVHSYVRVPGARSSGRRPR